MKRIIRLTERDLTRIVKRTIMEMDKENILKAITQGRPVRRREYSADDAIAELKDYVYSNTNIGKNQLLRDMERISELAAKELSDEDYEKFMKYYDDLENQIHQELSDDEEDDYEY
jgi:hypothetical protein